MSGVMEDTNYLFILLGLHLRKILKCMAENIPLEDVKKHGELCPGGDLRIRRNRWLYDALLAAGKGRLLREGRFRTLVGCLNFSEQLCRSLSCPDETGTAHV